MYDAEHHEELSALIDLNQWTFILNRFSEVLGIDIYTVDRKGKVITTPQHAPKMMVLISAAKEPARLKFKTLSDVIERLIQKSETLRCPVEETDTLGVTHALIPIVSESPRALGYLVAGPFLLGSRKMRSEIEILSKQQGWDPLALEGAYQELKLFSFVGMKAMLELLSGVCNYLVQPATLKGGREKVLSELAASWEKDRAAHLEKLNFFSTLLDLALRTSQADSGSVMVLDPDSQTLRIRAAHGLEEDVVQKTRVKIGEGIAGWAAAKNQSLLLDPETAARHPLRDRLKRSHIDSSIVMPLSRQNQVLGVLNINSHSKENRLRMQNLDLLTQLAKLTMVVF